MRAQASPSSERSRQAQNGREVLTPEQIAGFRRRLEAERRAIERRIGSRAGDIGDTVRDEEGVGDSEDEGQRIYDREDDIVSDELDAQQLEQVNKALARIEAGTYGLSEVSGKPIPLERLEAVPSATTLVNEESV
jgi:RNA polymerase-binding transcription factor DksA